jgi:hypothetical protein
MGGYGLYISGEQSRNCALTRFGGDEMNTEHVIELVKVEARLAREAELINSAAKAMVRAQSSLQSVLNTSEVFIRCVVENSGVYIERPGSF